MIRRAIGEEDTTESTPSDEAALAISIYDRIDTAGDGLSEVELLSLFPADLEKIVMKYVGCLLRELLIVKVRRVYATEDGVRDHWRYMVLRGQCESWG